MLILSIILMNISQSLTTYYFIVASNKFLIKDEPVEEILRERIQYCRRMKSPKDFWFISAPEFLESNKLSEIQMKLASSNLSKNNCSAIVSPNQLFITWLKLRFQTVLMGSFVAPNDDIPSPLGNCKILEI